MKTIRWSLLACLLLADQGAFAKCDLPVANISMLHAGVWRNLLLGQVTVLDSLQYGSYGTVYLAPGDSVRISAVVSLDCATFDVEHVAEHWTSGWPFGFPSIVVADTGIWNMTGCAWYGFEPYSYCEHLDLTIALDDGQPHTSALSATMRLEGAQRGTNTLMGAELSDQGLIPLNEPYSALGLLPVGSGGETTTSEVLDPSANLGIVDWVVIDLRDAIDPHTIIASKCGLLRQDGRVLDVDGLSPLTFNVANGAYHIAARHRNHLGIMTAQPIFLSGGVTAVPFDQPAFAMYGTNARTSFNGGKSALWSGNALQTSGINKVKYAGANNDRDPILQLVGGSTPTHTTTGYYVEDVNMDGVVKYTGAHNDSDPILVNIGGTVPTAVRFEQLPY